MRLKENADVLALIKEVNKCEGDVFLTTREGDSINLKSTLCQFVAVAMLAKPELLYQAELKCAVKEDEKIVESFCNQ